MESLALIWYKSQNNIDGWFNIWFGILHKNRIPKLTKGTGEMLDGSYSNDKIVNFKK